MKPKYVVELDSFECRLIILSLVHLRNKLIAKGFDTLDVDKLLIKMEKFTAKKWST